MSADANSDRTPSETVYLELSDGQSHKFYEVTVHETEVTICYGRIGTAGQSSSTTYATVEKAQAEARKKINEKLRKGYRKGYMQVSSGDEVSTVVEQPISPSDSVFTVGEVHSHCFDLARLQLGIYEGCIVLGVPLQGGLVAVEITAICNSPRFTINLDAGSDIAYHFDVRSLQGQIVQNTCVVGAWGTEERLDIPPEFASSEPFTLKLAVDQTLVVYLNDRVVSHYAHRLPPTQINAVHLVYPPGNLQIQSVQVFEQTAPEIDSVADNRGRQPSQFKHPESPSTAPHEIAQTSTPPTALTLSPLFRDLPSQFEPLRRFLESNLQPYIKIHFGEAVAWLESDWNGDPLDLWQSKVGGYPYLPKGTVYPIDRETGELMMFLMQVNCADLPIIDGFDLPQQGILQFYSGLNVPMCELRPEQHRILYFPEIIQDTNELVTDFSFLADSAPDWEGYEYIYPLTFSAQQDVFWSSQDQLGEPLEVPDALARLGEEFDEWIWDYEFDQIRQRQNKLGGYVELHSEVDEVLQGAKGRLLLELNHEFNSDDHFYFFIKETDLANLDFSNVESYFLRV